METPSTPIESRKAIVDLVGRWLSGAVTTETFISEYWPLRRSILDRLPSVLTGAFGSLCSELDSAINAYADKPEEPYEIDERQLRSEASRTHRQLLKLLD